jgi:hypothetical protein
VSNIGLKLTSSSQMKFKMLKMFCLNLWKSEVFMCTVDPKKFKYVVRAKKINCKVLYSIFDPSICM